jgi:hypothetical protein
MSGPLPLHGSVSTGSPYRRQPSSSPRAGRPSASRTPRGRPTRFSGRAITPPTSRRRCTARRPCRPTTSKPPRRASRPSTGPIRHGGLAVVYHWVHRRGHAASPDRVGRPASTGERSSTSVFARSPSPSSSPQCSPSPSCRPRPSTSFPPTASRGRTGGRFSSGLRQQPSTAPRWPGPHPF